MTGGSAPPAVARHFSGPSANLEFKPFKRRFKNLNPKFCVHRVPDSERLPTSATCANLLKLPDYVPSHIFSI